VPQYLEDMPVMHESFIYLKTDSALGLSSQPEITSGISKKRAETLGWGIKVSYTSFVTEILQEK